MKTYAIDYYGGFVPSQSVAQGRQLFILPGYVKQIRGWEGALSVFGPEWWATGGNAPYYFPTPGMHGDTWLSLTPKVPGDKAGDDVFGILKAGDAGHDSKLTMLPEPIFLTSPYIYLNYWIHNMRGKTGRDHDDWHAGYVFYY